MSRRKAKVGLALSGGAARGFAHIGVLSVLEKAGLKVSCLAGTSMGALVGALYAAGMKVGLMERLLPAAIRANWVDFGLQRMGLIKGDKIEQFIHLLTRRATFEELKIPFAAVAVDLYSGKTVVIREGLVCRAVRASISIPGYFVPVEADDGRLLVDGGVLNRIPTDVVREMGADYIIASDTGFFPRNAHINSLLDVVLRSFDIMQQELNRFQLMSADIVISPALNDLAPSQFDRCTEIIQAGEEAARAALPEILARLG